MAVSYGVGHRHSLDPVLLWLWCKLAATALIRPLAWESPCAVGAALEKTKRQKNQKQTKKNLFEEWPNFSKRARAFPFPVTHEDSRFSTSSPTVTVFHFSHPSGIVVSHCGFDLHFPDG